MERARLFFGEAFRSLFGNLSTTVAATMTVLIGMFLLGLFIALGSWVVSWTDHVKKEVLAKVFFENDAKEKQLNAVRNQLVSMSEVSRVVYVSPDDALKRMRKQFPELTQAVQPGYNLLHGRISYDFNDDRSQFAVWSQNLTDEEYFQQAFPTASTLGVIQRYYQPPRSFGIEVSHRF